MEGHVGSERGRRGRGRAGGLRNIGSKELFNVINDGRRLNERIVLLGGLAFFVDQNLGFKKKLSLMFEDIQNVRIDEPKIKLLSTKK